MPVLINQVRYLIGPRITNPDVKALREVDISKMSVHIRGYWLPRIMIDADRNYYLCHQPNNSNWPAYHPLRTQSQLLENWV